MRVFGKTLVHEFFLFFSLVQMKQNMPSDTIIGIVPEVAVKTI